MTKEEAKYLSDILKAYSEGKEIEVKSGNEWIATCKDPWFTGNPMSYRVKPEPKYRPYKNAEEFLKGQKEHGLCFKWIGTESFHFPNKIDDCTLRGEGFHIFYSNLLERCIWQDGHPCGILDE